MGYHINLNKISIDIFKDVLRKTDLIPSWKVLGEDIDTNLEAIKACSIANLEELKASLKSKEKLQALSQKSGLAETYLTILKRMVNGYHPKPIKIKDFNCVDKAIAAKLEDIGIKNTQKLYDKVLTAETRKELSEKTGIDPTEIDKLTKLTDLCRIRWVNHTFSIVLLEAGFDSANKVAKADCQNMYDTVVRLNKERELYKAKISVRDMKLVIESAQDLDHEIAY